MKKGIYLSLFISILYSIQLHAQTAVNLDAASFNAKIKQIPNGQIIDVRTSGEYAQGHIQNSINIDISSNDFTQKAAKLDKSKAIFVYCLSGARSSSAMSYLNSVGFKEIYNLAGGMMRWRAANLPETTAVTSSKPANTGMTMVQFQALLNTSKLVLVDYYGEWCAPCKKMKPYLDEIQKEMKDKVVVVRIDVDANKALLKELKIGDVPVLSLYKGKKLVWTHSGFISKEDVVKKIKAF